MTTTQKAATTPSSKTNNGTAPMEEKILFLDVRQIHADYDWNSRSGAFWLDIEKTAEAPPAEEGEKPKKSKKKEKVTEHGDWIAFMNSILETGTNVEPIICRPPAKAGGKVRVVAGFRRFRAVLEHAEKAGFGGPTEAQRGLVRAVVREMTDQEARLVNGIENIAREDISGPDLCAFVGDLVKTFKLNDSSIASKIGKSQPYVSKLHRFYDALSVAPGLLEKWRTSPIKLTNDQMEKEVLMMSLPPEKRPSPDQLIENFERVLSDKAGSTPTGRGKDGWIETKKTEAHDLGALLGLLKELGHITIVAANPTDFLWECVDLPSGFSKKEPKDQKRIERAIVGAFNDGVNAGMKAANEEEEGEEEEEEDEGDDE